MWIEPRTYLDGTRASVWEHRTSRTSLLGHLEKKDGLWRIPNAPGLGADESLDEMVDRMKEMEFGAEIAKLVPVLHRNDSEEET